jgi:hypothetical protein
MSTDESSAHDRVDGEPSGAEPAPGPSSQPVPADQPPIGEKSPSGEKPPNGEIGYASVARRVSGWTTNLLATAIVVLIALLFGRQLIALWRAPEPFPSVRAENQLAAFDDPLTPLQLEFGNSPMVLHRQPFLGDLDEALQQLCQACAEQLKQLPRPASKTVSAAEASLLARVTKRPPLKLVWPDGALYQLDDSLPVVVGTKLVAGDPRAGSVGNLTERVVTWGIAVPGADEGWTLYAFGTQGDDVQSESAADNAVSVPLPPGAERILSIRWPGGGCVTAFSGAGEAEHWEQFFDKWFEARSAERTIAWCRHGDSRYARYSLPQGARILSVDIQFSPITSGEPAAPNRWRGMTTETPGND